MAYTNADTSAKVGFRPYHHTDPFGAAHLSGVPDDGGLGEYHLSHPFDPWELYGDVHQTAGLHGLGQNHPFKPQAWHLHGLGGASDAVVVQAVQELQSAHQITPGEAQAILDGSMTFQDVLGFDPTDQSSWMNLVSLFREVNQDLQALEQSVHDSPAVAQAIGRELIARRNHYTELLSQFVHYYALVMGSAPSGLSGLGFAPIVTFVAGAVVFVVLASIALYALRDWSKSIEVSHITATTQQTAANTQQALAQQLAKAQASGDTVTANTILGAMKQVSATTPSAGAATDLSSWFVQNAGTVALVGAGLIVLGPLSQGLFGKRRR